MAGWRPAGAKLPGASFTQREMMGAGGGGVGFGTGSKVIRSTAKPVGNPWKPGPRADAARAKHARQDKLEARRADALAKAERLGKTPVQMYEKMKTGGRF